MNRDLSGLSRRELLKQGSKLMAAAVAAGAATPLLAQQLVTLDVASAGSIRPMLEGPLKTSVARTLNLDLHIHAKGADAVAEAIVDGSLPC